jgi:Bacterial regulatory helix-turn-helix protein, lysR family
VAYPKTKRSRFNRTIFDKKSLTLRRLKGLVEVAEHGGIAPAAPCNRVRQSQLSTDLKKLSTYFGVELIRRVGNKGGRHYTRREAAYYPCTGFFHLFRRFASRVEESATGPARRKYHYTIVMCDKRKILHVVGGKRRRTNIKNRRYLDSNRIHHTLKSPLCLCVSIVLSASS